MAILAMRATGILPVEGREHNETPMLRPPGEFAIAPVTASRRLPPAAGAAILWQ
jgi:hypothetical protein